VQKPLPPPGRKLHPVKSGRLPTRQQQILLKQLIILFAKLAQYRNKLLVAIAILLAVSLTQIYGYFRYGDFPSLPILLINNDLFLQTTRYKAFRAGIIC
jgi:hypothetical protein